ncbi:hypothetical protein NMY22_g3417 [Coprinellus aureogranulatus]|nr:hypothetical protein NMY22_g3417 [Coprinellus aureogranulatus]
MTTPLATDIVNVLRSAQANVGCRAPGKPQRPCKSRNLQVPKANVSRPQKPLPRRAIHPPQEPSHPTPAPVLRRFSFPAAVSSLRTATPARAYAISILTYRVRLSFSPNTASYCRVITRHANHARFGQMASENPDIWIDFAKDDLYKDDIEVRAQSGLHALNDYGTKAQVQSGSYPMEWQRDYARMVASRIDQDDCPMMGRVTELGGIQTQGEISANLTRELKKVSEIGK